jgi:hypothetical protein
MGTDGRGDRLGSSFFGGKDNRKFLATEIQNQFLIRMQTIPLQK